MINGEGYVTYVDVSKLATYRRTHSPSQLAWFEGWQLPGAESALTK